MNARRIHIALIGAILAAVAAIASATPQDTDDCMLFPWADKSKAPALVRGMSLATSYKPAAPARQSSAVHSQDVCVRHIAVTC